MNDDTPLLWSTLQPALNYVISKHANIIGARNVRWLTLHHGDSNLSFSGNQERYLEIHVEHSRDRKGQGPSTPSTYGLASEYQPIGHLRASRSIVEELIGEEYEAFPSIAYKEPIIQQWIHGERPVQHRTDPWKLEQLISSARTILDNTRQRKSVIEGSDRLRQTRDKAIRLLAGKSFAVQTSYTSLSERLSTSAVRLVFPSIPEEVALGLENYLCATKPNPGSFSYLNKKSSGETLKYLQ